jgi:coronin-1B/1C/6
LGKVPNAGTPLVKGHSGPIMDMDFSPFHDNMLATASGDTTLRLWQMPEIPMKASVD